MTDTYVYAFETGLCHPRPETGEIIVGAAQEIFSRQRLAGFSFDVEDLVIARRLGHNVQEEPIRWKNAIGTKVTALAGLKSFGDLLVIWFNRISGSYTRHEPLSSSKSCLSTSDKISNTASP